MHCSRYLLGPYLLRRVHRNRSAFRHPKSVSSMCMQPVSPYANLLVPSVTFFHKVFGFPHFICCNASETKEKETRVVPCINPRLQHVAMLCKSEHSTVEQTNAQNLFPPF